MLKGILYTGVFVPALWIGTPGLAQTSQTGSEALVVQDGALDAPVEADSASVILVIAQRRAEALQDEPNSISAYSGDMFESRNVGSAVELVRVLPIFGDNLFDKVTALHTGTSRPATCSV